MTLPIPLRQAHAEMASIYVAHDRFVEALQEIAAAISVHGTELEMPCLQVTGPSGVGKSTLLAKLAEAYQSVPDGRELTDSPYPGLKADHIPLPTIEMSSQPSVKSEAMQILNALHDPRWNKGDRYKLEQRVDHYLRACGTIGLVVDEAQRAVDRNGVVVSADLVDWYKGRHAKTGVIFVFLGLGRLRTLFELDTQFERRWDNEIPLEPYRWFKAGTRNEDDLADQAAFTGFLVAFAKRSPLPFAFDVTDPDSAHRLQYACRGAVGWYKKILLRALRVGHRKSSLVDVIDFPLLAEAFERAVRWKLHGMINPFGPDWRPDLPTSPIPDESFLPSKKRRGKRTRRQIRMEVQDALSLR